MIYIIQHTITNEILGACHKKDLAIQWASVVNYSKLMEVKTEDEPTDTATEIKGILSNLFYAVPNDSNDADWWPDELRKAMDEAKIIIES